MDPQRKKRIQTRILKTLTERDIGKTMCPSEALPPSERSSKIRMEEVREIAAQMAAAGKIEITQKGVVKNQPPWKGPIRLRFRKSMVPFETQGVDFRRHPDQYRVGKGEQGVLSVEPYKSELLPLWRFKTVSVAEGSARALWKKFLEYSEAADFVGMDMARKFIQMGFSRARRYANHKSGKKYVGAVPTAMKGRSGAHGRAIAPLAPDPEKAKVAEVFRKVLKQVEGDSEYSTLRAAWKKRLG